MNKMIQWFQNLSEWYGYLNKKAIALTVITIIVFILFGLALECFPILGMIFSTLCIICIVGAPICLFIYLIYVIFDVLTS